MFELNARVCFVILSLLLCFQIATAVAAPAPEQQESKKSFTPHDKRQDPPPDFRQLFLDLQAYLRDFTATKYTDTCTAENVIVRKDWDTLTADEKIDWIDACKCLNTLEAKSPSQDAPGILSRWDEFVADHIRGWKEAHLSPWLFAFHGTLLADMEIALREECGYRGGIPYVNFAAHAGQPKNQWSLFDGSETSLGGDGKPDTPRPGCWCVTDGRLADWTVNLGPVLDTECSLNPQEDGLGLNPRCVERQFNESALADVTFENIVNLIYDKTDVSEWSIALEIGPHGLPHNFMGGTAQHVPSSLNEVWFLNHHAMVDLLHKIWLSLDFDNRIVQFARPDRYQQNREDDGLEPAPEMHADDDIQRIFPFLESAKVRDLMWSTQGKYCYRYE